MNDEFRIPGPAKTDFMKYAESMPPPAIEEMQKTSEAESERMVKLLEKAAIEAERADKESGLHALNQKMNSLLLSQKDSDTFNRKLQICILVATIIGIVIGGLTLFVALYQCTKLP